MPYVYEDAESLAGNATVGTKQCVALVKKYGNAPASSTWQEGDAVRGNTTLKKGTAIATFVDGKYPNLAHGNHAAFYLSQDAAGIWVVDQWSSSGTIRKRHLPFRGTDRDGNYVNPSENADAFSVVK